MTLHQAIEAVLEEARRPLTADQIAFTINRKKLYQRGDEQVVLANQIRARIEQYSTLFKKVEGKISLQKYSERPKKILQSVLEMMRNSLPSHNQGMLILYLLFYVKVSDTRRGKQLFGEFRYVPRYRELKNSIIASLQLIRENRQIVEGSEDVKVSVERLNENLLYEVTVALNDLEEFEIRDFLTELVLGQIGGEWSTPISLARYISRIVVIRPDESLYDPFAGTGTLANEIMNRNEQGRYHLRDINSTQVFWGTLSLALLNPSSNFTYDRGDSLDVRGNYHSLFSPLEENSEKYDWVVTHPPFGLKYSNIDQYNFITVWPGYRSESVHIQLCLYHLNTSGKAILIIPEGFLFSSDKATNQLKKLLVQNDWIEAVHSLPTGTFMPYSSLKASVLILNKQKTVDQSGRVFFKEVLKEELFEEANVSANEAWATIEEIAQNDFLLMANRYIYQQRFKNLSSEHVRIKELIVQAKRGIVLKKDFLKPHGLPFITIKHLTNSPTDFKLSLDMVDTFVDQKQVSERHLLTAGTILVATIGTKLKATLFNDSIPAAYQSHVLAINVKRDIISSEYFIYQLNQPEFLQQLEMVRAGSGAPFVSVDAFLKLFIRVPSRAVQDEELVTLFSSRSRQNENYSLESEKNILAVLKHEFGNLKVPVVNFKNQIKRFVLQETPVDHPIRATIDAFEASLSNMTTLFSNVDKLLSIDSKIEKVPTDLIPFMENTVGQYRGALKNAEVYIQNDANYEIMVDPEVLSLTLHNFFINSARHGFSHDGHDQCIVLDIHESEDEAKVVIDMINNGLPLPEDFSFNDLTSFGLKAGKSKGSGIGGYLMKRAVEINGGELTMPEWPGSVVVQSIDKPVRISVGFRIQLPYIVTDKES